jgi:hypothetical protein
MNDTYQFNKHMEAFKKDDKSAARRNESKTRDDKSEPAVSYISRGSNHNPRMRENVIDPIKELKNSKYPIIRICLTGGPCAGKTTALASLN